MGNTTNAIRDGGVLRWANANTSASAGTLWAKCPINEWLSDPSIGVYFYDDFLGYLTATNWTSTLTNSGTAAITTGLGGHVLLTPSDGSVADDDEAFIYGTSAAFQVAAGKDLWWEAEISFAEANTDDINVVVGMTSVGTTGMIQAAGAGPSDNYDGLVAFKVDGGTQFYFESSVAATQSTSDALITRVVSTPHRIGGHVTSNTLATFYHNGAAVWATTTVPTATLRPFLGVKNGSANNEGLKCNWFRAFQLR